MRNKTTLTLVGKCRPPISKFHISQPDKSMGKISEQITITSSDTNLIDVNNNAYCNKTTGVNRLRSTAGDILVGTHSSVFCQLHLLTQIVNVTSSRKVRMEI